MKKDQKDLLKELRKMAREAGLDFEVLPRLGKGSHIRVRCGDRRSTIPGTVGPALRQAIKQQLGLA